jgi:hypothetical protein
MFLNVPCRRRELGSGDPAAAVPGKVAAKAVTAVGGASVADEQKDPVPVMVNKALCDGVATISYGVVALIGKGVPFPLLRLVLSRYGIN